MITSGCILTILVVLVLVAFSWAFVWGRWALLCRNLVVFVFNKRDWERRGWSVGLLSARFLVEWYNEILLSALASPFSGLNSQLAYKTLAHFRDNKVLSFGIPDSVKCLGCTPICLLSSNITWRAMGDSRHASLSCACCPLGYRLSSAPDTDERVRAVLRATPEVFQCRNGHSSTSVYQSFTILVGQLFRRGFSNDPLDSLYLVGNRGGLKDTVNRLLIKDTVGYALSNRGSRPRAEKAYDTLDMLRCFFCGYDILHAFREDRRMLLAKHKQFLKDCANHRGTDPA